MTDQRADPHAGVYEVRLSGTLGPGRAAWFEGLTLSVDQDGTTVITGPVADQAALHGLIQRVRDLGIPLLSVSRIQPPQPTSPGPIPGPHR